MNLLELCQRTRELAGIAGTGPTTTVGQTGELLRLVNWVRQSWTDIQNLYKNWNFLLTDLSFTTVNGQGEYSLAQMGALTLRELDKSSLRCEITATGIASRLFMEPLDFDSFRNMYRFNVIVPGRPILFTVDVKDNSLWLAMVPDSLGYTITGRYWSRPVALALDTDTPAMPEEYHMLIVYWALSKYAGYEAATEVKQEAIENKGALLSALQADQLPDVSLGGAF